MRGWGRFLLWAVLALSLIGNAVTLGVYLRVKGLQELALGGSQGMASLPPSTRAALRQAVIDNRPRFAVLLAELGQARATMFATANAQSFDPEAVAAAQSRVREATTALQVEGQKLLLQVLEETRD